MAYRVVKYPSKQRKCVRMENKKIQITDFDKAHSYLQINTVKGFKYIDRAGELVNFFHRDNTPPQFNMNMQGLVIRTPFKGVSDFKISSDSVWMKCEPSLSSADTIATFSEKSSSVLEILEVSDLNRIGWRTEFLYIINDEKKYAGFFERLVQVAGIGEAEINSKITTGSDLKAYLRFSPALRRADNKQILVFDIDVYKEGTLKNTEIKSTLIQFWDYVKDENGFFKTVNGFVEKLNA